MSRSRQARGYLWSSDQCRQRVAVADALGHGDNVRNDPVRLESPKVGARPPEAGLNLQENRIKESFNNNKNKEKKKEEKTHSDFWQ